MELNKEFIISYSNLPVKNTSLYGDSHEKIEWEILKSDKVKVQYYFESKPEKFDFLWKAILFSLYSKVIYTYSLENYKYINDHFSEKYSTSDILKRISRRKLIFFIDIMCRVRLENSYNDFINHSTKRMSDYVNFFINISTNIEVPYCQIDFNKLLLSIIEEKKFREEFSNDKIDLSNLFLRKLQEELLIKKITLTKDCIFKELLPKNYQIKKNPLYLYYDKYKGLEDKEVQIELIENEITTRGVLYYPSSGMDIEHLFYLNDKVIPEIQISTPKVYIHSDACDYHKIYDYNRFIGNLTKSHHFRIINESICYNEYQTVVVLMLQRPNSKEYTWLICFWGYENEKVIKAMINNNIVTPIIYSKCDGITSGMGRALQSIPTILYPLLNKDLKIKYIVTEQSWKIIKRYQDSQESFYNLLIDGLKSLKLVSKLNSVLISKLLELENDELLFTLEKILQIHVEVELPHSCGPFMRNFLLKKIKSVDQ
jgi:hypothetical protein